MIEIAILKSYDGVNHRAHIQLAGSLTTYLESISVARNIPAAAMVVGNRVILAIPGGNPKDACVIATWPGGSPPGPGDMLKSVYDTDDDGVADAAELAANALKLEGSTKAEVRDHVPIAHKTSHQDGGTDEISVAGLSGELADPQKSNFLKLSDTPDSYSGHGGKVVTVKTDVSGLEFTTPSGGGFTYTAINPPTETSPASASTWLDWDLSGSIPSGAKYAVIFIRSNSTSAYYGMVRKKGDTSITNTVYLRYYALVTIIVELDANRVCQRYATNTGVKFGVLGYIN